MSDINAIANAFIEHYYTTYAQNRAGLAGLYTDSSYMSYEGTQVAGTENIMAKLNSLAFKTVQHKITSKVEYTLPFRFTSVGSDARGLQYEFPRLSILPCCNPCFHIYVCVCVVFEFDLHASPQREQVWCHAWNTSKNINTSTDRICDTPSICFSDMRTFSLMRMTF